ncbi:MAG TPA: hypothetical protein VF268_03700, partial [Gammaproteobacteria bacterium]
CRLLFKFAHMISVHSFFLEDKMKSKCFVKCLLIAMVMSSGALAVEQGPNTTVEYIYSRTDTGKPFINFADGGMPGCYANKGGYLSLVDEKGTDRTYSLLLSAFMSGKAVRVYYHFNTVEPGYSGWGLCDIEAVAIYGES